MVNADLLKEKIREKNLSVSKIADEMDISRSTFYRKINNDGQTFLVKEVGMISEILDLSSAEFNDIFFASESHKCD